MKRSWALLIILLIIGCKKIETDYQLIEAREANVPANANPESHYKDKRAWLKAEKELNK